MAEAEAKLRKLGPVAFGATDVINSFGGTWGIDDATGKQKVPGASMCLRCLPERLQRTLYRRSNDIIGVGGYLALNLIGHIIGIHLLQPADALVIRVLRPASIFCSCLFNLSWLGIIYHGPGRLPPQDSAGGAEERDLLVKSTTPELAIVMRVGLVCHTSPFGPEDRYCQRCSRWKHPFVHHCSTCNQCSIWMDHHCKLTGQCIGFRNFRCFIVWLVHLTAVYWCLVLLTLHRLYRDGWPRDLWFLTWGPWFYFIAYTAKQISGHMQKVVLQLAGGWHGRVIRHKFEAVFAESKRLHANLHKLLQGMSPDDLAFNELTVAADTLAEAEDRLVAGVQLPFEGENTFLWGPFLGKGADTLRAVFGEPCSWRWLLPAVPGGCGNPFGPEVYSERGCKAWVSLRAAMEEGQKAYMHALCVQHDEQERLQALLASAEKRGHAEP